MMAGLKMSAAFSMTRPVLAAVLLTALAACTSTTMESATPDVTNAPAAGFQNVQPGSEEDFILNVGRRTYFTQGSAELDSVAKTTLDNQAVWLKKYPRWLVKLQGFADDNGSPDQMVALSQKRADVSMAYLVAGGVDASRLWAKGYGKDRLVRECTENACKVQNRRVVSNLRNERDEL
jgi:peptidoglycan-associated lipoprotein